MITRFKDFTKYISLAYKYLLKIKSDGIKEFGLKGSHVMCLFYIGEAENGLTATNLCQLCCEDKAAISKALSALCDKGYIVLENGENKKYRSSYFLTESGRDIMEQLNNKIKAAVSGGGTGLSEEERETFYRCLARIVVNLEEVSKSFSTAEDE